MVVVEEGRQYIGRTIDIMIHSVLQTSTGRMIFGRPKSEDFSIIQNLPLKPFQTSVFILFI